MKALIWGFILLKDMPATRMQLPVVFFLKSDTVAQKPLFPVTISPFLHVKILLFLFRYVWIFHFLDWLFHFYHRIPTMQDLGGFLEKREFLSFSTHKPNVILEHSAFTNLKTIYTFYGHKGVLTLVFTWQVGWRWIKRHRMKTIKCSWRERIMIKLIREQKL